MRKIRLGKTGIMATQLGFGGIPIQTPPEETAISIVRESLALGINFIDTSRMYTNSEARIGKAIAGKRSEVIIATKSATRTADGVAADMETSLKDLQTDFIDLYQFHNVSTPQDLKAVLAAGGPFDIVRKARDAGTVKHIGITSHRLAVAKEALLTDCFETVMLGLNFVNTDAADEVIPLARERDIGIIIMKPMAGGMLANPVLSFKYLQQFPDVVQLIGIARLGEMPENINIVETAEPLTETELAEMNRIKQELGSGFCRMCNYCQPCPQKIMISAIMYTEVALKRYDPEIIFKGQWDKFMQKVDDCSDCGECEKRCPYELPIRERIKAAALRYTEARTAYMNSK